MDGCTQLHPQHQHCELFPFIMDCFQHSRQLSIHKHIDEKNRGPASIQVTVLRGAETCTGDVLLFVHLAHYPFPRLPSRIVECSSNKLVIKCKMLLACRSQYVDFEMTFLPNTDDAIPQCWWTVSLAIKGSTLQLYVLRENCCLPEWTTMPLEYEEKTVKMHAPVLFQPNDSKCPNIMASFIRWHPSNNLLVLLEYHDSQRYHRIDQCFAIFAQPRPSPAVQPSPSSAVQPSPSSLLTTIHDPVAQSIQTHRRNPQIGK